MISYKLQEMGFRGQGSLSIRLPSLEKYDGAPDFDQIDHFFYEINNYFDYFRLTPIERLKDIQGYLKEKAAQFYMQNIARCVQQWTMACFGCELFNYFFPRNFIELIRKCFNNLTQGHKPLLDYSRNIEILAE